MLSGITAFWPSSRNWARGARGFKLLFGSPVHALHQAERMAAAWRLIESGPMSVTEAGQHLGYSNLSRFGAAFKREYGLLPSELRRRASST